jgi:hypothetical protein
VSKTVGTFGLTRFRSLTRREDAERFIEELRRLEPELANSLRIEEHEIRRAA